MYYLTARKQLAAIDWNYHLETKTASNAYGETSVSRKYNQRPNIHRLQMIEHCFSVESDNSVLQRLGMITALDKEWRIRN